MRPAPAGGPPARASLRFVRRSDRLIGIVLGLLAGVAIVVAFVFFGSREAIDAPSIDSQPTTTSERQLAEPPR